MNLLISPISYLLTYLGYFLGKVTKYEHKEIKPKINTFILFLITINYAILATFFYTNILLVFVVAGLTISIFTYQKYERYNVILLFLISIFLNNYIQTIVPLSIATIALCLRNSIDYKVNFKEEIVIWILIIVLLVLQNI